MAVTKKLTRVYSLSKDDVREAIFYYLRNFKDQSLENADLEVGVDGSATVTSHNEDEL